MGYCDGFRVESKPRLAEWFSIMFLPGRWVRSVLLPVGIATGALFLFCPPAIAEDAPNTAAFYTQKVRPIFVSNCGKCHFNMSHKGGFAMDNKRLMMKGGRNGPAVIPGDPANSMLLKLIRHEGPPKDPRPMPPKTPRLSDADIAVIERWIRAGAVMPNDPPR
jgi:cytochrome c